MGRLAFLLGCLAAVLVVALPAAANEKPNTGTGIPLGNPPATFPADTPFHIKHGFTCDLADASCMAEQISARSEFDLYLDGVLQPSTIDVDIFVGSIRKLHLTNYPAGLPAGTYTFVGLNLTDGNVVLTRIATITFT